MRVFLTGATGLVGRAIVAKLVQRNDTPLILSRRADEARRDPFFRTLRVIQGNPTAKDPWQAEVDGCDAVINLAGRNLFDGRWNARRKDEIRDSRVHATDHVVQAIASASKRPGVLVQASAIGFYGPHGDEMLMEDAPPGSDFMARVSREWEAAAAPVAELGARLVAIRTGVVLAKGEGALKAMTPIFRLGGGSPIGGGGRPLALGRGRQWLSWIHLDDIVGLFLLGLDSPAANGPMNGTAPNPARNYDFSKALARALRRPMLPIGPPDAFLKLLLGEVADAVTHGQRVLPAKALRLGYVFRYPGMAEALAAVFIRRKDAAVGPAARQSVPR